jgi:putative flippase GtrA
MAGIAFYFGSLGTLYVFRHVLRIELWAATLVSAEVSLVLRFLINDRWVFNRVRPSWQRLWRYHLASAGGAGVWWLVANVLPRFGVHYLLAATAGSVCAAFFGMASNFLWIWRKPCEYPPVAPPDAERLKQPLSI